MQRTKHQLYKIIVRFVRHKGRKRQRKGEHAEIQNEKSSA